MSGLSWVVTGKGDAHESYVRALVAAAKAASEESSSCHASIMPAGWTTMMITSSKRPTAPSSCEESDQRNRCELIEALTAWRNTTWYHGVPSVHQKFAWQVEQQRRTCRIRAATTPPLRRHLGSVTRRTFPAQSTPTPRAYHRQRRPLRQHHPSNREPNPHCSRHSCSPSPPCSRSQ